MVGFTAMMQQLIFSSLIYCCGDFKCLYVLKAVLTAQFAVQGEKKIRLLRYEIHINNLQKQKLISKFIEVDVDKEMALS